MGENKRYEFNDDEKVTVVVVDKDSQDRLREDAFFSPSRENNDDLLVDNVDGASPGPRTNRSVILNQGSSDLLRAVTYSYSDLPFIKDIKLLRHHNLFESVQSNITSARLPLHSTKLSPRNIAHERPSSAGGGFQIDHNDKQFLSNHQTELQY